MHKKDGLVRGSAILSLVALATGISVAQEYRGRVQGNVSDPSHAAVADAKVSLKNINTGIESSRQTDSTGHYLFDFVQPGTYSVSVETSGFQKFVQENVTVLTGGDVTVNAVLTVGAVTQTVNVSEEVAQVRVQHLHHDHHGAGRRC